MKTTYISAAWRCGSNNAYINCLRQKKVLSFYLRLSQPEDLKLILKKAKV